MMCLSKPRIIPSLAFFALLLGTSTPTFAQDEARKEFPLVAQVAPTGEELSSQTRMWIMEVHFKPMRMIAVPLTNPETGKQQIENVWYIVYKAINRPLPYKVDMTNTASVNDDDQEPIPQLFVPVFTLRTDDITGGQAVQKTYHDVILPEAQVAIIRREGRAYRNSVEIIQAVPAPTPEDQGDAGAIYGVAMFRGVDRATDYFSVYMAGFSNGYRYVNIAGDFTKLKELAQNKELLPSDAVWDGSEDIRGPSEVCNWQASIKAQTDVLRPWRSAASVGGLFDDVNTPPADAQQRQWFYTKTAERYPRDKRPPVWRRTIIQHYSRFGDEINETEKEFRACLEPTWMYWPDDAQTLLKPPMAPPAETPATQTPAAETPPAN
jgi:hypothetical protein